MIIFFPHPTPSLLQSQTWLFDTLSLIPGINIDIYIKINDIK